MQSGVEIVKIKVNLGANTLATMDLTEPVILPENELVLAFESDVYRLGEMLLSVRNDTQTKQYKIRSEQDIKEFLTPSTIECEISMLSKGNIVKTWRVPDIIVKEYKPTFELTPEIADLRQADKDLQGAIKDIFTILKNNNLI